MSQSASKRRPLADTNNRTLSNIDNKAMSKCSQEMNTNRPAVPSPTDQKLQSTPSILLERADTKKEDTPQESNVLTPENVPFNPNLSKNKSPRRMLLTKRALNMTNQAQTKLFDAVPAKRHHSGGDLLGRRTTVVVGTGSKAMYKAVAPSDCKCFALPSICSICMARYVLFSDLQNHQCDCSIIWCLNPP